METLTTRGIKVSVVAKFEAHNSNPDNSNFVFSYHIQIDNLSNVPVQLLSRHWIITNSFLDRREVKGEGVIGVQPILQPGHVHNYSSWSPIDTNCGKMSGSFLMKNLKDQSTFEVKVPEFKLIANFVFN